MHAVPLRPLTCSEPTRTTCGSGPHACRAHFLEERPWPCPCTRERARHARAVWRARSNIRSSTRVLPAARRSTAAYPPSIHRFRARRAAQRRLVCIHWASCPDEQRSVGSIETMILDAADSSAASQLHPSQSSYRKRAGSGSGHFRCKKSLETGYAGRHLLLTLGIRGGMVPPNR